MLRIIVWLMLGALIVYLVRSWWRNLHTPADTAHTNTLQDMLPCDYCGLHVPRAEAVSPDGKQHYCCPEHLRLDLES